jgi:hypothetical protein
MGNGMNVLELKDSFNDSYDSKCFLESIVIPEITKLRRDGKIEDNVTSTLYLGKELGAVISYPEDKRETFFVFDAMPELKEHDAFCGVEYKVLLQESPYDMERLFTTYSFAYDGRKNYGSILSDKSLSEKVQKLIADIKKEGEIL